MRDILIKKNDGEYEIFNSEKLIQSLKKSGARDSYIDEIIIDVQSKINTGASSDEVYSLAFDALHRKEIKSAVRYSLRRSILALGPTGFPFEIYVSKLLEHQGYTTATNQVLKGNCVDHEVDVVAWNEKDLIFVESKFHNDLHLKTDIKTTLYVKARFDDLKNQKFSFSQKIISPTKPLIITNTKFTGQSIEYAKCAGIDLIGWDYPSRGNLYHLIEDSGLYPLTSLNSLNKEEKIQLLKNGILDCKNILQQQHELQKIGIPEKKIKKILDEVRDVCMI